MLRLARVLALRTILRYRPQPNVLSYVNVGSGVGGRVYTTGSTNKPEISSSPTGCQIGPTYLRSTNTIEDHEHKRLQEPGERQVAFTSSKEKPATQGQDHLWKETCQRRSNNLPPK